MNAAAQDGLVRLARQLYTKDHVIMMRLAGLLRHEDVLDSKGRNPVDIHQRTDNQTRFAELADRVPLLRALGWFDLPKVDRTVLALMCRYELTADDIASRYGADRDVILKIKERALDSLAEGLQDDEELTKALYPDRAVRGRRLSIPFALRCAVYQRDGYRCRNCGVATTLTCDHILAFSVGGATSFANLQTLCHSCNARKHKGLTVPS